MQLRDTAVPERQGLHSSLLGLGGQGGASEAAPKQGCHKHQAGRPQALEGRRPGNRVQKLGLP